MIPQCGTLQISASRLTHNVKLFQQRVGTAAICATVKADAYGHGVDLILPVLKEAGVKWVCVYSLAEAWHVAEVSPELNVLVLSPMVGAVEAAVLERLRASRVRVSVNDVGTLERISAVIGAGHGAVKVHVQVDTGLTRTGVAMVEAAAVVRRAMELPGVELEGIFSHLSHGDVLGHETVAWQAARLWEVADPVKRERARVMVHLQNSGGAWHMGDPTASGTGLRTAQTRGTPSIPGDAELDMVRIGIGLYGLQPSMADRIEGLLPVARIVAPVLAIHDVAAGVGVGYGHLFVTGRASRLAIVPVGYGDGYPRALTGRGVVQVDGKIAKVVGRVSMDQIVVDVTDLRAEVGDEVVVMSDDAAAENGVDNIAKAVGTIGYEIATGWARG